MELEDRLVIAGSISWDVLDMSFDRYTKGFEELVVDDIKRYRSCISKSLCKSSQTPTEGWI